MELDSFTITLILIIAAVILGLLARIKNRDKCLVNFNRSPVTIEKINGEIITKGVLKVKTTGLEINFPEVISTPKGFSISSFLVYKYEFPQIQAIIRPHEELSSKGQNKRQRMLRKVNRPTLFRVIVRKIRNLFNSLKDSFVEVMNISISYLSMRKNSVLVPHDKYVRSMNTELLESVGLSHEPLLEPYIGHRVVFEMIKSEEKIKLSGILSDYTKDFIVFMDVDYKIPGENNTVVDLIVPQKLAIVRHLSEKIPYKFPFIKEIKSFSKKIYNLEQEKEANSDTN